MDAAAAYAREGCEPGLKVVFEVEDNGCGMEEEVLSHCFEPFFTTREVGRGSGLGLAQIYGIVQQNQGCMEVESEPGRGTDFRMFWPSLPEGTTEPEARPVGGEVSLKNLGRGLGLLLVEDEEKILRLAERYLLKAGFRVISALSGELAEAHFIEHQELGEHIDILFTDIVMPGINGLELARRLRQRQPGLKVIYSTGYSDEMSDYELSAGEAFIPKPYTVKTLLETIQKLLYRENG
jgi:CheY-like chemotaxis protein